jgi:sugar phosphate isomerase/epimerase
VDVSAADIGPGAHVDQEEAAARPEECGRRVRELAQANELELEELFVCPVFVDGRRVEVSHPDAEVRARLLERFDGICAFARAAGFRSVMGVPGTPQPGISLAEAWSNATGTLRAMVRIAADHGVRLNVEPHTRSLIEQPADALALAGEVPGLTFTLDYSHFVSRGIPEEDVYPLHARTAHMHARQARPGSGGCAVEEGTIAYEKLIEELQSRSWDGVIAMELFGKVGAAPWNGHAVVQNVALAHRLAALAGAATP